MILHPAAENPEIPAYLACRTPTWRCSHSGQPLGGTQAGEGHRLAALLGHSSRAQGSSAGSGVGQPGSARSLRADTHRGDPASMAGRPPPAAGPPHRGSEGRGAAGRDRVAVLWGAVHLLVPPPGQGARGPHGAAGAQDRISTKQPAGGAGPPSRARPGRRLAASLLQWRVSRQPLRGAAGLACGAG